MIALLACTSPAADSAAPIPWEDPLVPGTHHILVHSTPGSGGPMIEELATDLTERWRLLSPDGSGSAGAVRHADGGTTFARTWPPPTLSSAIDTVDAEGTLVGTIDAFFSAVSFVHGLVETPGGNWIVADTLASRVFCTTPEGEILWTISWDARWPNGISLTGDQLAVTLLYQSGDDETDAVEVWQLTDPPELEWQWTSAETWPHGPHIDAAGEVTLALAATGQVATLADGEETWRSPAGALAFPRDALPLPDGSLLIADGAAEIVRVDDPRGAFRVVASRRAPGVYGLGLLDCSSEACLGAH